MNCLLYGCILIAGVVSVSTASISQEDGTNGCIDDRFGGVGAIPVYIDSARQSTMAHRAVASRAVDTIRSGNFEHGGCTHTNTGGQAPWWSVQFRSMALVKYVEIQNRIDCCADRLKNFHILVDDRPCTYYGGHFIGRKRIYCDQPVCGRSLTIKLSDNTEPLTLCDVQAYGPMPGSSRHPTCSAAAGDVVIPLDADTARQSDITNGGVASRAIDGNRGATYSSGACTHTSRGNQVPWWSVQFQGLSLVRAVEIQNREDCCEDRLNNFYIMVDDQRCAYHGGWFSGRKRITCDSPVCGRTLTIKLATDDKSLTLCDVRVFGRPLWSQANQCIGTGETSAVRVYPDSALQLSTTHGGVASRAVDGNHGGVYSSDTCTHTQQGGAVPWWSVRFVQEALVKYVEIQNRVDCCADRLKNFYIEVDDKRCTYYTGTFNGRKRIYCDHPVCGRSLTIRLSSNAEPLTLCDVQISGQQIAMSPPNTSA